MNKRKQLLREIEDVNDQLWVEQFAVEYHEQELKETVNHYGMIVGIAVSAALIISWRFLPFSKVLSLGKRGLKLWLITKKLS